jgi:hypothetical protein
MGSPSHAGPSRLIPIRCWCSCPPLFEGGAVLLVDGPAGLCGATRAVMLADVVLTTVQPAGADLRSAVEVLQLISQARRIRGGGPMPSCTCTAPQRELCC